MITSAYTIYDNFASDYKNLHKLNGAKLRSTLRHFTVILSCVLTIVRISWVCDSVCKEVRIMAFI